MVKIYDYKQTFVDTLQQLYGKELEYTTDRERYNALARIIRIYAGDNWRESKETVIHANQKQVYYFSMEFLMGRLLTNNLMNLGIYNDVAESLQELGIDINDLENAEDDAGLGNGGLGRLAACFLDSIASLGYPGQGNSIRYQYGFFKQNIRDGYQYETVDPWLLDGKYEWEISRYDEAVEIGYGGYTTMTHDDNGNAQVEYVPETKILAVPYDVPVIGHDTKTTNTLRLWKAEPFYDYPIAGGSFEDYEHDTRSISNFLYPDDSTHEGRKLRLKQQYFFSSAGVHWLLERFLYENTDFDNLPDKIVIQINDTHPTLVIPELMRLLLDEYGYSWERAWNIVSNTVAYTNHTILTEALESWPVEYVSELFPRVYQIIEEIDRRFRTLLFNTYGDDRDKIERLAIISDGQVRMAYLAIVGSFSVNGVAALHTEILKNQEMSDFYDLFPEKFNNKTNGVTHRRWFAYANPELAGLVTSKIGDSWMKHPEDEFKKLLNYKDDQQFLTDFLSVKQLHKEKLARHIAAVTGIEVDTRSIFDIQIKRLHAYKRQLLNILHVIYLYNRLKNDPSFSIYPRTFIFGAKSAPSYAFAKQVIKLINTVAERVNHDGATNHLLKVVFLPNYNVSQAELLFPAADVSEQISTAGKEASGTGNMKFMMNGAVTLGTLDGANVEIHELVGDANIVIFGMTDDEVDKLRTANTYVSWDYYHNDPRIKTVLDSIAQPETFADNIELSDTEFNLIIDDLLMHNDSYYILKDFASYVEAQERIDTLYRDKQAWARICIHNIAMSGFFSSDRTIEDYVRDIWHIEKIKFTEDD